LRSNTQGYGDKTRWIDSQHIDTTTPSGRELYHLQFSLQATSPETSEYTLVHVITKILSKRCFFLKNSIENVKTQNYQVCFPGIWPPTKHYSINGIRARVTHIRRLLSLSLFPTPAPLSHSFWKHASLFSTHLLHIKRTLPPIVHKLHRNCPCRESIWSGTYAFYILLRSHRILGVNRQFISVWFKPGESRLGNKFYL